MRITSKKGSGLYLQLGIKHRNMPTISLANCKARVAFLFFFKGEQKWQALRISFKPEWGKNQQEKDLAKVSQ